MARTGVQLVISDPLDDDLVESDPRNAQPRYRCPKRHTAAGEPNAVRHALARCGHRVPRLLRFPLLPGKIRPVRPPGVLQASMAHQHRARDAEADAG